MTVSPNLTVSNGLDLGQHSILEVKDASRLGLIIFKSLSCSMLSLENRKLFMKLEGHNKKRCKNVHNFCIIFLRLFWKTNFLEGIF